MKKREVLRGLFLFLSLISMAVIFHFSSQTAEQSAGLSNKVVESLLKIFSPNFNSLEPAAKTEAIRNASAIIRISAHFGEYLVLGLCVASFIGTYDLSRKKHYLYTILFCVLYAISDEIHQYFVPGRSFQITDILVDTAGSVAGLFILIFIEKMIKNYRRKKYINGKTVKV